MRPAGPEVPEGTPPPSDGMERIRLLPVVVVALVVLGAVVAGSLTSHPRGRTPRHGSGSLAKLVDDFSSGSGWATFSTEVAGSSYVEGGYRLRLDRPADDGLASLVLPGEGSPSVAATAIVVERSPAGGLVGVGCVAGSERAYLGAVDPASSGFVILRLNGKAMKLLRSGATEEGALRGVGEENELQIQCRSVARPAPLTLIRLFANGQLLAAYEDAGGLRSFRGLAVGGVSLRRPLDALFRRAGLQALPPGRNGRVATACDRLVAVGSLEADYGWLADSGGTRLNTSDFDSRRVLRIVRELAALAGGVEADARLIGQGKRGGPLLLGLADRLRAQRQALNSLTNAINRKPIDPADAALALSCPPPRAIRPPWPVAQNRSGVPPGAKAAHRTGVAPRLDEQMAKDLPAPPFVPDPTLHVEPDIDVEVDLRYDSFRIFGESIEELDRSLRVHAIHVGKDLAAGVTYSQFETHYERLRLASGCNLVPEVKLGLLITLPEWEPPASAGRYLRNQWNQFMWDLDDHERHHAGMWIEAANRMTVAINGTPPVPSCKRAEAAAEARVERVYREYARRQRAFDHDVAAGTLPGPSLP
jgi:predicted secreted Zn-dependent protease